jgi:hypothetical protein
MAMISCLKEGSNHLKYTGSIYITKMTLPDSAKVGDIINVDVTGGGPNGCWTNLELSLKKSNDSLVLIYGSGIYESTDGICSDYLPTVDSTFKFKVTRTGSYMFVAHSPDNQVIIDSVFVKPLR